MKPVLQQWIRIACLGTLYVGLIDLSALAGHPMTQEWLDAHPCSSYEPEFKQNNVQTFRGKVVSSADTPASSQHGLHLRIEMPQETVSVYLTHSEMPSDSDWQTVLALKLNDVIQVTGTKQICSTETAIVPVSIGIGSKELKVKNQWHLFD